MSKLYIANATRQNYEFTYRLPEAPGAKVQTIPVGGQVIIAGGNLTTTDVDYILSQYKQYGLVSAEEMDNGRVPFSGLAYSLERPISADRLEKAMNRNIQNLVERGKKIMEEAAISVNNSIEHDMQEQQNDAGLSKLEMSVVEEESRVGDRSGPRLSQGVRVTRNDPSTSPKPVAKRAGKR